MIRRRLPGLLLALSFTLLTVLLGCAGSPTDSDDPANTVVARHSSGRVTVADLDRYLSDKASDWKWQGFDDDGQWQELIERVAVEQILGADRSGTQRIPLDGSAEVERRLRDLKRRVAAKLVLADEPRLPEWTRADLESHFEARRDELEAPERRRVYHLFRRYGAERDPEPIRRELEDFSRRVSAGESFPVLARESSDSESRHQDGLLGLVSPGQFSADFDSVVFALAEGSVSEPIFTADGGHLFFISDVLPERRLTVEDVTPLLLRELGRKRYLDQLCGVARRLLTEVEREPLTRDYFEALMQQARPPAVMFRVGDFELTFEDFRHQTEHLGRGRHNPAEPLDLLEEIYCSEVLLQEGLGNRELPAETLQKERRRLWVEKEIQARLRTFVAKDEERLQQHYERHLGRFSRPVTVTLTRLRIPIQQVDTSLMGRLEDTVASLDAGESRLEDLAASLDGAEIDTLLDRNLAQLQGEDPRLVSKAFALQPGGHSPPFTSKTGWLSLLRLDERKDAEPIELSKVRARVVEDLVNTQGPALYREWSRVLLAENDLTLLTDLDQAMRLLARLPS